jgi:hypothetical protein
LQKDNVYVEFGIERPFLQGKIKKNAEEKEAKIPTDKEINALFFTFIVVLGKGSL